MASVQRSESAQNMGEMRRWADRKAVWGRPDQGLVDDWYLAQINRKWRSLGRQARQPASLRGGRPY